MEGITLTAIEPVHTDERGEITDLLNEPLNHIGYITSKQGSVRGDHYHKLSTQYNYVFSGAIEILTAPRNVLPHDSKGYARYVLTPGQVMTIKPEIVHRFTALEDSTFLDMISESRAGTGFEDDVYRVSKEFFEMIGKL